MNIRRIIGSAVLALGLLAPAASGAARPEVARLADGTELVVAQIPGARTVSFRYLIHAGSAVEPGEKAGLAHLLEHMVLRGNARLNQRRLFNIAREHGAYINAFTSAERTVYVLDGVLSRDLDVLLTSYVGVLTSPSFLPHDLKVEREVISAEAVLTPTEGLYALLSALLLSGAETSNVIGNEYTRSRIEREDLVSFYAENYRASNTTAILTGDIDLERARAMFESGSLLPPDRPAASEKAAKRERLGTPVEVNAPSPVYLTLYGYDLDTTDDAICRGLAALIELRLNLALNIQRSIASGIEGTCMSLGGHQLVITLVTSSSYSGSELPELIEGEFRGLVTNPLSVSERAHLERRTRHQRVRTQSDPALLAEALVEELAKAKPGADRSRALRAALEPTPFQADAMQATARRSVLEGRKVVINAAPF